ncbi:2-amino-4-hydroxy-6-hydroxymethyldihydropteridine diphosphokinase [Rodentibacter caecimuris]|uniref:2-amino-4-hydroxy-6-hydroxymethyldihydropteridine pyrophosphokinase n=1 Tax=Rodentibacter caecimuris TaxID=1796644 RepID=A0ABX3KZ48_9PAST|nr:2-amino-4-hydroxy-6-hydroxymethyldihydropteridine diphosphokinase [Rodentibacter heylii]
MEKVYIALGSNLNNPIEQLNSALYAIETLPHSRFEAVSSFYQSKPLGPKDQPDYVNAVTCIYTRLSPIELLDYLQHIENQQGRVRLRHWGERTLDLDILLYGGQIIQSERLTVPHYDMQNREFVLIPLLEIAPDLYLPNGQAVSELVQVLPETSLVRI